MKVCLLKQTQTKGLK